MRFGHIISQSIPAHPTLMMTSRNRIFQIGSVLLFIFKSPISTIGHRHGIRQARIIAVLLLILTFCGVASAGTPWKVAANSNSPSNGFQFVPPSGAGYSGNMCKAVSITTELAYENPVSNLTSISAISQSGGIVTATLTGSIPSTVTVGSLVLIAGVTPSGYNGTASVTSFTSGTTSTLNLSLQSGTTGLGPGTAFGTVNWSVVYGASVTTWANAMANRYQGIGVNTTGSEGWDFPGQNLPPPAPPFMAIDQNTLRLQNNTHEAYGINPHIKNLGSVQGPANTIACSGTGVYLQEGAQPDYFDNGPTSGTSYTENFATGYAELMAPTTGTSSWLNGNPTFLPHEWAYMPEESDFFYGFDGYTNTNHPDGILVAASQYPSYPNDAIGTPYVYNNHMLWAKYRLYENYLPTEYGCYDGSATISAISQAADGVVTATIGTSVPAYATVGTLVWLSGVTPSGYNGMAVVAPGSTGTTLVLSLQSATLSLGSGTTGTVNWGGSADPAATNYCGSTEAASSLAALNTAWGLTGSTACTSTVLNYCNSAYTTWGTTDAGGIAGITGGTYATGSWGVGTGALDENGKRILPTGTSCHVTNNDAYTRIPQIKSDLTGWGEWFMWTYGYVLKSSLDAGQGAGAYPPTLVAIYDGPSWVYTAVAQALTADGDTAPAQFGFWIAPANSVGLSDPSISTVQTTFIDEVQRITTAIQAGGVERWIDVGDFMSGNSTNGTDCALAAAGACSENICYDNQVNRGLGMIASQEADLSARYASGDYSVAAVEHFGIYDSPSQNGCFGIADGNAKDNLYDGTESTAINTTAACAVSTVYTFPTGGGVECTDGNGNLEFAYGKPADTCTTASTLPAWPTQTEGLTAWGTQSEGGSCYWANWGSASTLTRVASSAGYGLTGLGGLIKLLRAFWTGINPGGATGSNTWTDLNSTIRSGVCDPAPTATPTPGAGGLGSMGMMF